MSAMPNRPNIPTPANLFDAEPAAEPAAAPAVEVECEQQQGAANGR